MFNVNLFIYEKMKSFTKYIIRKIQRNGKVIFFNYLNSLKQKGFFSTLEQELENK